MLFYEGVGFYNYDLKVKNGDIYFKTDTVVRNNSGSYVFEWFSTELSSDQNEKHSTCLLSVIYNKSGSLPIILHLNFFYCSLQVKEVDLLDESTYTHIICCSLK